MPLPNRRALLRVFLRLPIIAGVAHMGMFGFHNPMSSEYEADRKKYNDKFQAVKILRLINTIQRSEFEKSGRYVNLATMPSLDTTKQLLEDGYAEKAGIGRSLYSKLRLDSKEIVPGWELEFKLKADNQGYVVTISDCRQNGMGAFASDQIGIIHQGQSLVARSQDDWQGANFVAEAKPIEVHSARRFGYTLASLVFGPTAVSAAGKCCQQFPCPCIGACQGGSTGGLCTNCGCGCCVFCCRLF